MAPSTVRLETLLSEVLSSSGEVSASHPTAGARIAKHSKTSFPSVPLLSPLPCNYNILKGHPASNKLFSISWSSLTLLKFPPASAKTQFQSHSHIFRSLLQQHVLSRLWPSPEAKTHTREPIVSAVLILLSFASQLRKFSISRCCLTQYPTVWRSHIFKILND